MMQTARMVDIRILMWMVVQVFLIFAGGLFNCAKSTVDFGDRHIFLRADRCVTCTMFQVPTRITQVGQCMQVARVLARNIRVRCEWRCKGDNQGTSGELKFHDFSFLLGWCAWSSHRIVSSNLLTMWKKSRAPDRMPKL